ncbi:hypothetical protein [Kitasatospora herbaricolor]|uniref:DUF3618 domain-containing protein n=1 Tax=Kitasatospora herbaricolor TaxID=68217 RepID=A0ABZ1W254_9ACTN|nr:hypothetical protein [Kitasatospora herbaricolor]
MTDKQGTNGATGDELRAEAAGTREEPGRALEASADKADLRERGRQQIEAVKEQAVVVKDQAQEKIANGAEPARDKVAHAVDVIKDHTPDQVLEQGGQLAAQVRETVEQLGHRAADSMSPQVGEQVGRAADSVKANRRPLLVAAVTAVLTIVVVRRLFGRRR